MLRVQKFLKSHSVESLREAPYNLQVGALGNLILLKYNQFDSDFANKIVQECRGIILEKDTWNIVCHPYHKFFNMGESNAYKLIDLNDAHVFEKADGSIIKVYHYDNEWRVATNGTIDADLASNNDEISFKTLFFDVISEDEFINLTNGFDTKNTYLFEIIHPAIQIVVDYENKKELILTGIIKNETGDDDKIVDYDILTVRKKMEKLFGDLPIRYPRVFDLSNVNDVDTLSDIADVENIHGNNFEGFVVAKVYDGRVIARVKIKSPKYISLHRIATGDGVTNNLVGVLLENELEEFEAYLDKIPVAVADEYRGLKNKYFKLIEYLYKEGSTYRLKATEMTRKDLALIIQKYVIKSCNGFIFTMVDNSEITPEELLRKMGTKKVKSLLN